MDARSIEKREHKLPAYFEGLRDDQILYVNCFEDMPLAEVLRITGGNRTVLVGEFRDSDRRTLESVSPTAD